MIGFMQSTETAKYPFARTRRDDFSIRDPIYREASEESFKHEGGWSEQLALA